MAAARCRSARAATRFQTIRDDILAQDSKVDAARATQLLVNRLLRAIDQLRDMTGAPAADAATRRALRRIFDLGDEGVSGELEPICKVQARNKELQTLLSEPGGLSSDVFQKLSRNWPSSAMSPPSGRVGSGAPNWSMSVRCSPKAD